MKNTALDFISMCVFIFKRFREYLGTMPSKLSAAAAEKCYKWEIYVKIIMGIELMKEFHFFSFIITMHRC